MRRILAVLVLVCITAYPVLADINQKADLNGDNKIVVRVAQMAWNHGDGDVNQNAFVRAAGNIQMINQDSLVVISDDNYSGNINNSFNGNNSIRLDLLQFTQNYASGNVSQGIEVVIEGNIQILDQDAFVIV